MLKQGGNLTKSTQAPKTAINKSGILTIPGKI